MAKKSTNQSDPRAALTSNFTTLGTLGSGKPTGKISLIREWAAQDVQIIVIDPEREYDRASTTEGDND